MGLVFLIDLVIHRELTANNDQERLIYTSSANGNYGHFSSVVDLTGSGRVGMGVALPPRG